MFAPVYIYWILANMDMVNSFIKGITNLVKSETFFVP